MLPKKRPPTHPGEMLLKEFLEPMGMTQVELAKHLSWTWARLNEIVNGRRGVNATCFSCGVLQRRFPKSQMSPHLRDLRDFAVKKCLI